jgi:serine/threonine-protein phosphatase PGAM5
LWVALAARATSCVAPVRAPRDAGPCIRTVLLVRHGAYDQSRESKHVLIPMGRKQARLTGRRLAVLPGGVDEVYVSPITRARETAEIACRELGSVQLVTDPDLAEGSPPVTDPKDPGRKATEEELAFRDQMERVFARYFRPSPDRDVTVVLFCHGNVIRYLWSRALAIDPGVWQRYQVSNANVTEIRVDPDGAIIGVSYNDIGHLPPRLRTFSWRSPMYPQKGCDLPAPAKP